MDQTFHSSPFKHITRLEVEKEYIQILRFAGEF